MEMEVHRRTVSDFIFLCEKFFEPRLFCGRNKKPADSFKIAVRRF